jgi:uncharacterized protein YsxB (DUF464 family)
MIEVNILRNHDSEIYGFQVDNHGDSSVCSAVSALALNTVNSIETFFNEPFECEDRDDGGYLRFVIPAIKAGKHNHDINLLLKSFVLGMFGIEDAHPETIKVNDV